jgi:hypothetical protein
LKVTRERKSRFAFCRLDTHLCQPLPTPASLALACGLRGARDQYTQPQDYVDTNIVVDVAFRVPEQAARRALVEAANATGTL